MCNRKTGESVKKTRAKKTQSILQVWRFFRFYVGRAFSLWEKHHMQQRLLSEGANLSLQKAIDISLSLDSVIKQVAVIQNEFKQPSEAVSITEQPKMYPFTNKNFFFSQK